MLDKEDMLQTEKDINDKDIVNLVLSRLQTTYTNQAFVDAVCDIFLKTERGKEIIFEHMTEIRMWKDLFYIEIS